MSSIHFVESEFAAAVSRGVRQCVLLGSRARLHKQFEISPGPSLQVFIVDEKEPPQTLARTLEKSHFDSRKASLFLWLGDAGYRTVDAVIAALAFIASLPAGTGVVFDYAVERTSLRELTRTALDALASRVALPGGVKYLIQPQAVAAMLRGVGFRQMQDLPHQNLPADCCHIVSALV